MDKRYLFLLTAMCCTLLFFPRGAPAEEPIWWDDALAEAEEGGYEIVDEQGLRAAKRLPAAILIDTRPDYEFHQGHIPGSVNFEFHLGDKFHLAQDKRRAFKDMLGPFDERPVILYCRSFR